MRVCVLVRVHTCARVRLRVRVRVRVCVCVCVCLCRPVDSSSWLVPRVVGDPDVTLVDLHGDRLILVVEQDAILLRRGHLHTHRCCIILIMRDVSSCMKQIYPLTLF